MTRGGRGYAPRGSRRREGSSSWRRERGSRPQLPQQRRRRRRRSWSRRLPRRYLRSKAARALVRTNHLRVRRRSCLHSLYRACPTASDHTRVVRAATTARAACGRLNAQARARARAARAGRRTSVIVAGGIVPAARRPPHDSAAVRLLRRPHSAMVAVVVEARRQDATVRLSGIVTAHPLTIARRHTIARPRSTAAARHVTRRWTRTTMRMDLHRHHAIVRAGRAP